MKEVMIMSKKHNEKEKEIIRLSNKISECLLSKKIPRGEDVRQYFNCYDYYRTHKMSHLIPRGAKNIKIRLIKFLINELRLSARVSVDPVQKEYGNSGLNFNKLIMIALEEDVVVAFHVNEEKFNGLKEINRLLLPTPYNKRAIGDYFDAQISKGKVTVEDHNYDRKYVDHFVKYLANHNKVNEHNNQNRKEQ